MSHILDTSCPAHTILRGNNYYLNLRVPKVHYRKRPENPYISTISDGLSLIWRSVTRVRSPSSNRKWKKSQPKSAALSMRRYCGPNPIRTQMIPSLRIFALWIMMNLT